MKAWIFILIVLFTVGGTIWWYVDQSNRPDTTATIPSTVTDTPVKAAPSATIDTASETFVSGTAQNIASISVNIIATGIPKTLYGRVVPVTDGHWSLSIPSDSFTGFTGPFMIEVGIVNNSGSIKELASKNIVATAGTQVSAVPFATIDTNTLSASSAKATITLTGTAQNIDHALIIVVPASYTGSTDAAAILNANASGPNANKIVSAASISTNNIGDGTLVTNGKWSFTASGGLLGDPANSYKVLVYDFSASRYPTKDLSKDHYQLLTTGTLTIKAQ